MVTSVLVIRLYTVDSV